MNVFSVWQINLTDEQIDEVNNSRDETPEFYNKYTMTTFNPTVDRIKDAIDMYEKVAVIEADDLEGVYRASNLGEEDRIERLARMHSVSVGDLIETEDGKFFYVDTFGFSELPYDENDIVEGNDE